MKGKNILITGGAGFIGSNLAENLLDKGNSVICLDNFDPYYSVSIKKKNIEISQKSTQYVFIEADILNIDSLRDCFRNNQIDIIIHLAAKAGVRPSLADPGGYYNVNVAGTLNILEVMKEFGVRKLIFASSSSVYGNNEKTPFSEADNVDFPISPYAATKKAGELLCHTYHHLYGFDIFCLRFFTVYGPRQRPDLAIYKFTKALLKHDSIDFYGDGSSRRDYTHISDILKGITGAIANVSGFDIFNLGESNTISLLDLINYLEEYTGEKAIINMLPMQAGDVNCTYADITKARNLLGYKPEVDIREGLLEFVKWFRQINLD
jgi:UDP-glucuronate 4-epimerase